MATRKQKVKVGIFLITCFAVIGVSIAVIAGLVDNDGVHYWMEFDASILGLGEGGLVEYLGVPVGKVSRIYVTDTNMAHVDLLLDTTKVTLREGVEAQLVLYSFAAGTMAISLRGGELDAPVLPPGSEIPAKASAFATISSQISDLMSDLSEILEKIGTGFEGMEEGDLNNIIQHVDEVLEGAKEFLENTDELVRETTDTVRNLRDDAETAIQNFSEISGEMKGLSGDVGELIRTTNEKLGQFDVEGTQEQLNQVLENISSLTEKLNQTAEQIDGMTENALHDADNIEFTLRTTLRELTETFESVNSLTKELQQDPSSVIRGRPIIIEDNQP